MKRAQIEHLDRLAIELGQLDRRNAYALAVACVERYWPVLERGALGREREQQALLRAGLDSMWRWVEGVEGSTVLIPESAIAESGAYVDQGAWAAREVAISVFCLSEIVREQRRDRCISVAQENLRFLDAFIYELTGYKITSQNDLIVDAHPLMVEEIRRQSEDLEHLRQPMNGAIAEQLRNRASGRNIIGREWFGKA